MNNTMPNLDELLDAMLSSNAEDNKFVPDSISNTFENRSTRIVNDRYTGSAKEALLEVSSDAACDYYFNEEYDSAIAGGHAQLNGFDENDDPSALSTIEFTNSNASRGSASWASTSVGLVERRRRRDDSDGGDDDDDSLMCLDSIPVVDYDDCFEKFLDSVKGIEDDDTRPIEIGPLKSRRHETAAAQLQNTSTPPKRALPDLHISNNMSKSQTGKATKTILFETRKTVMEMDKLEMRLNEMFTKASQQAATDFKALRDAIMNREAHVLAGLRRAKDNAARTIRRQKMSAQSIQKACEQKFDGDPKRLRQLADSFEHFYTASGDVLTLARQTPYKFRELKDLLEAIENAGVFVTADSKAN